MVKGDYEVQMGAPPPCKRKTPDTSFRSCMFAIIIFIILCIILIVVTWAIKKGQEEPVTDSEYNGRGKGGLRGGEFSTSTTEAYIKRLRTTPEDKSITRSGHLVDDSARSSTSSSGIIPALEDTTAVVVDRNVTTDADLSATMTPATISSTERLESPKERTEVAGRNDTAPANVTTTMTPATISSTEYSDSDKGITEGGGADLETTTTPATISSTEHLESSKESTEGGNDTAPANVTTTTTPATISSTEYSDSPKGFTEGGAANVTTTMTPATISSTEYSDSHKGITEGGGADLETITTPATISSTEHLESPKESTECGNDTSPANVTTTTTPATISSTEYSDSPKESTESGDGSETTSADLTKTTTPATISSTEYSDSPKESTERGDGNVTTRADLRTTTTPATISSTEYADSPTGITEGDGGNVTTRADLRTTTTPATISSTEYSDSPTGITEGGGETETTPADLATTTTPKITTLSSPHETSTTLAPETTCSYPECKRLAGRMLVQMDHESDPCSNFYMYACGGLQDPFINEVDYGWKVVNRIAEQRLKGEDIFTKYNTFYDSCIQMVVRNETEIWKDEVLKILIEAGMTNVSNVGYKIDFTKFFTTLIKYHSPQIFDIVLDVDDKNSSKFVLKMNVPMTYNPFVIDPSNTPVEVNLTSEINLNHHYAKHKSETTSNIFNRAVADLRDILTTLNSSDSFNIGTQDALHIGYYMETFAGEIVKAIPDAGTLSYKTLSKKYTVVTVDELQRKYSLVNWKELLKELLGGEVSGDADVQLYFEDYFNKIFAIIQGNKPEKFQAMYGLFLFTLYDDIFLQRELYDRYDYCFRVAMNLMEDLTSAAYIRSFERHELTTMSGQAHTIFNKVKDTFERKIQKSTWVDSDRIRLLDKLKAMTIQVDGGEELFRDDRLLHERMNECDITDSTSYTVNAFCLLRRYRKLFYGSYNQNPADPQNIWTFLLLPHDTHGVSVYGLNTIVIPFGMMDAPFYSSKYPTSMLLAGLGFVIAHEIAHHFDSVGMRYWPEHKADRMLESPASDYYDGMETCFNSHYADPVRVQAEDKQNLTFTLNPDAIAGERLADNVATLIVYEAFRTYSTGSVTPVPFLDFTKNETFFIQLAQSLCSKKTLTSDPIVLFEDVHLPSLLRVNSIASQSKEFSDVFKCADGAPLKPARRCEVFPDLSEKSIDTSPPPSSLTTSS